MKATTRDMMRQCLIDLLNASLRNRDITTIKVTYLSDDFEEATVLDIIKGTTEQIKADLLLPEDPYEKEEVSQKAYNRGTNAEDVRRVRATRIG